MLLLALAGLRRRRYAVLRALGASRLLWEIGEAGTETLVLRRRLGLDSGYLSRLLRRLEAERLVTVTATEGDQRMRRVTMTAVTASATAAIQVTYDGRAG